ncbi:MAG: zinc-ribbon domain containing protein [Candidatus Binatia bacterium]
MKSGKQRRQEISARRKKLKLKHAVMAKPLERAPLPSRLIPVNEALLAPNNSYGAPEFVGRGYYVDRPFRCVDCGKEEIWTGTQQKWWYEVAQGFVYSTAVRCRICRRKKRDQSAQSRRIHLEGIERKKLARRKSAKERSS